ncbi:hypothetical protein PsorP6_009065 [Peronosclerospora sorghi]|uniref:Uncharacterized protein n=1 Tax=Peronosclerospora sorghi TaxID=230839 RepID=A0ACC0VZ69_9STRA|nr:hypothetical protein PsorP6_009065 [Peronosclerospora sorghi]
MGSHSQAAQLRVKTRGKNRGLTGSCNTVSRSAKKPLKRHLTSNYTSDSDASDIAVAIPLPSLENGTVCDFVQERKKKMNGKRSIDETDPHAVHDRKKSDREEKAEKIVWRKFERENPAFEQFYARCLGLEKEEFVRFLACLKEPLPVYLRVNGNFTSLSEIVRGTLEMDFDLENVTVPTLVGGEMNVLLQCESWIPGKKLWKLSVDNKTLRKVEGLRSLSTYIRAQGSLGTLLRQDPATTLLPVFLDIQSGQRVLDLCGGGEHRAPIVNEYLCPASLAPAETNNELRASSLMVVNERDAMAAASAVRNLTRTLPLSRELIVTAHTPEEFPLPKAAEARFDRVICCVPCSGDGLVRKFPEKWRTWSPEQALRYHPRQVGLAEHALTLVRTGGSLLYSTRSLNPIENEAVVAELLRRSKGALELGETDGILEGLKRSHGLSTWDVLDVASWDDASEDQRHSLRPSMWPPTPEERDKIHLERCVRLLPHQNDTNGVFFAVIRKICEPDHVIATVGPAPLPQSTGAVVSKKKKRAKVEQPLSSFSMIDKQHLASIQSFFGLRCNSAFLERTGMARQNCAVHVVSPAVAELVTDQLRGRLRIYRAGVLSLRPSIDKERSLYMLTDEGARALLPEMNDRVLSLPHDEFTSFLESREMWLKHAGGHAREQLAKMTEGSLVVALDDMEPAQTGDRDILLIATKRHNSCSILSSPTAIARVKALLEELTDTLGDEDGYDSFEYEAE